MTDTVTGPLACCALHQVLSLRISWGNIDFGLCNMMNYMIYVPKTEKVVTWPCLAKSEN